MPRCRTLCSLALCVGRAAGQLTGLLTRPLRPTSLNAGRDHSCAILEDWTLKCWGRNNGVPLGYPGGNNVGDEAGEMGDNLLNINLGTGRRAMSISAGGFHRCAVLDDRSVKCWGRGSSGQLGYQSTLDVGATAAEMGDNLPVVNLGRGALQVSCGDYHTCAVLDDNTLKCWGDNSRGQLGYGDTRNRGNWYGTMGNMLLPVDLGQGRLVLAVATGDYHTCALLDNGKVKCFGDGVDGELGYGDQQRRGDGPGEMGDNLPIVDLGTGYTAAKVSAGWYHTCVLLTTGELKCWGYNAYGQLGLEDTMRRGNAPKQMGDALPAVDLGSGRQAADFSLGVAFTCALLNTNETKCWGQGTYGQLGYGDYDHRGDSPGEMGDMLPAVNFGDLDTGGKPGTLMQDSGDLHSCVLLTNGRTKCWGYNIFGQLGIGTNYTFGNTPFTVADALPPTNLGVINQDIPPPTVSPVATVVPLNAIPKTTTTSTPAPAPSPWVLTGGCSSLQAGGGGGGWIATASLLALVGLAAH